jgi:SMODS and SLOG-associating 2TM effector domain 3/SMODS and SLOG-associating 2TM effector domain 1
LGLENAAEGRVALMTKKSDTGTQGRQRTNHEPRMATKDYPTLVRHYDLISLEGQSRYLQFILVELTVAMLAALLSDLVHDVDPAWLQILEKVIMILLGLGLVVQIVRLMKREDQSWFEGRAVAESAKTLTWRYMMKVQPFHEEPNLEEEFMNRLKAVLHGCRVCEPTPITSVHEITQRMRDTRGQSWEKRRDFYVASRLNDQIKWYLGKAKYNTQRSRQWLYGSIAAQIVAILLAYVSLRTLGHWNFVPFLTTVAASCVAWSQAKNFDELRESYRMAHDELSQIKEERVMRAATESEFLDAVVNSEGAISREHTMWAARSRSPVVWRIA